MAGIADKLKAIDNALGEWYKVGEDRYINLEGEYLLYNKNTNRLLLNGILILLDNGQAVLADKLIKFEHLRDKTYHLTKKPVFKK